ncbi:hypothetical protein N656DRAFT_566177 [Canariomyces notabilis]|uniref:Uncharacterized protein n=1 Tax=Canariomyces notabilis TaxID=2074819 RepID=A0AAN6TH32_9PEZI|nr:hypothetical protein N656DRAFT_566177 [Canariomyces arenarius]
MQSTPIQHTLVVPCVAACCGTAAARRDGNNLHQPTPDRAWTVSLLLINDVALITEEGGCAAMLYLTLRASIPPHLHWACHHQVATIKSCKVGGCQCGRRRRCPLVPCFLLYRLSAFSCIPSRLRVVAVGLVVHRSLTGDEGNEAPEAAFLGYSLHVCRQKGGETMGRKKMQHDQRSPRALTVFLPCGQPVLPLARCNPHSLLAVRPERKTGGFRKRDRGCKMQQRAQNGLLVGAREENNYVLSDPLSVFCPPPVLPVRRRANALATNVDQDLAQAVDRDNHRT